jgi:hypothetical protein
VLENPTCRWSTRVCKAAGVDPLSPNCAAQAATAGPDFANCCLDASNDAFMDPLIQERAWTSPIWYRPETIGRLRAKIRYGQGSGQDHLALSLSLGAAPAALDPAHQPLTIRVTDDDDIFVVTIPAGTLAPRGRRLVLPAPLGGLDALTLTLRGTHGAQLSLRTAALDLSHADRADHMVTVALESGVYRASHTRLWRVRRDTLAPAGR